MMLMDLIYVFVVVVVVRSVYGNIMARFIWCMCLRAGIVFSSSFCFFIEKSVV